MLESSRPPCSGSTGKRQTRLLQFHGGETEGDRTPQLSHEEKQAGTSPGELCGAPCQGCPFRHVQDSGQRSSAGERRWGPTTEFLKEAV